MLQAGAVAVEIDETAMNPEVLLMHQVNISVMTANNGQEASNNDDSVLLVIRGRGSRSTLCLSFEALRLDVFPCSLFFGLSFFFCVGLLG